MTTTAKLDTDQAVWTEQVTYIATQCPDWCTLTFLHPCDNDYGEGRESRFHEGPSWGRFISAAGEEFSDAPSQVDVTVEFTALSNPVTLTPTELRQLSADALAAAEWLEVHQ